jgi:hypothetical protein
VADCSLGFTQHVKQARRRLRDGSECASVVYEARQKVQRLSLGNARAVPAGELVKGDPQRICESRDVSWD